MKNRRLLVLGSIYLVCGYQLLSASNPDQGYDISPKDSMNANECGPICASFACRYFGVPSTLDELVKTCGTDETGTTLLQLREGLRQKGLYAQGVKITPVMLQENTEYLFILPVREWGAGIDHYDVVMGSKGNSVLLLNYPSRASWFPMQRLVKYWDGHALAVSDEPINVKAMFARSLAHVSPSHGRANWLAWLAAIMACATAFNIWRLVRT